MNYNSSPKKTRIENNGLTTTGGAGEEKFMFLSNK